METRKKTQEAYTGLKREADHWTVYLHGMVVGECVRFSQAQATLAQGTAPQIMQASACIAATPPIVTGPQRVTIGAIGRRDWRGSRVVREERLELVQVDDDQPRPPKQGMSLNQAIDWREQAGFEAEAKTSSGMTNWISMSGGTGNVEARRRAVFVRRTA